MQADYSQTTNDIRVTVRSFYLADQSRPESGEFIWAYHIRLENLGQRSVQLLRRTWHIVDAKGRAQMVNGEGVIGQQPVLEPSGSFEYTSGTPLSTPSGFMSGLYHMVVTSTGDGFDVIIPTFSLDSPHHIGALH